MAGIALTHFNYYMSEVIGLYILSCLRKVKRNIKIVNYIRIRVDNKDL